MPRPKHPELGHLGTPHPASGLVLQRDQERAGQALSRQDDHEDGKQKKTMGFHRDVHDFRSFIGTLYGCSGCSGTKKGGLVDVSCLNEMRIL